MTLGGFPLTRETPHHHLRLHWLAHYSCPNRYWICQLSLSQGHLRDGGGGGDGGDSGGDAYHFVVPHSSLYFRN